MQTLEKLTTIAGFRAFEALPENADRSFELLEGDVIEVPSAKDFHAQIIARLIGLIFAFMEQNQLEGSLVGDNLDHEFGDRNVLKPDLGYTSVARKPTIVSYPKIAPDLTVEVVSPSNTADELAAKIQVYFSYGAQLIWIIYPRTRTVQVYRRGSTPEKPTSFTLTAEDVIDGGSVLPGFSVKVSRFFPTLPLDDDAL